MQNSLILAIVASLALICFGAILYFLFAGRRNSNLESLLQASRTGQGNAGQTRKIIESGKEGEEQFEKLKEFQRKEYRKKTPKATEEARYYHAGLLADSQQKAFKRFRIIAPVGAALVSMILFNIVFGKVNFLLALLGGGLAGMALPGFYLDRLINARSEEILYYLPLVIEQVAIGVSSSLDVGPTIQRIVQMADERDTHNAVTELLRYVELYVKSGVSLQESLNDIGTRAGHNELKHAFMALSQVAKHGGEISHQLQELANSVSTQRETKIDAKIKKLELKATLPVALVFFGFMATLMTGILLKVAKGFG